MNTIDVDALLLEVAPDAPCGPDLEYDPAFLALEREALGKPEVQYGGTVTAAVTPDWKSMHRMAGELLARSRDLRLALHLLRANLALNGIPGLADAVVLVERLLDTRWDSVHPMLDATDDNDPSLRINSLAILADTGTFVRELKDAILMVLPGLGPLTIRVLEVASGELPPGAGHEKLALTSIESAIADLPPGVLAGTLEALGRALGAAVNIEVILVRQVGSSQALNLDPLTRPLRKAHEFLARQQPADGNNHADAGNAPAPRADGNSPASGGARGPAAVSADIAGRDDVVRTLDHLLRYYRQQEPSSPIPILLERAKRLVPMDFLAIMQDLAPDGVAQLKAIRGPDSPP